LKEIIVSDGVKDKSHQCWRAFIGNRVREQRLL